MTDKLVKFKFFKNESFWTHLMEILVSEGMSEGTWPFLGQKKQSQNFKWPNFWRILHMLSQIEASKLKSCIAHGIVIGSLILKWPIRCLCLHLIFECYFVEYNFHTFYLFCELYKFSADLVWFGMVWTRKSQKSGPSSIKCQE